MAWRMQNNRLILSSKIHLFPMSLCFSVSLFKDKSLMLQIKKCQKKGGPIAEKRGRVQAALYSDKFLIN